MLCKMALRFGVLLIPSSPHFPRYFAKPCNCAEPVIRLTMGRETLAKKRLMEIFGLFCKAMYRAKLALFFNGLLPIYPLV
jgi:hypothetical protein